MIADLLRTSADVVGAFIASAEEALLVLPTSRIDASDDPGHRVVVMKREGVSDGAVPLTGLDVAELGDDGRLRQVVGFMDPMPAGDG